MKKFLSTVLSLIVLVTLIVFTYIFNINDNKSEYTSNNSSSSKDIESEISKNTSQLENNLSIDEISSSNIKEFNDKFPNIIKENSYTSFDDVSKYIKKYNVLPPNFITKNEAKKLGWNSKDGNLYEVAPGKSIGGDVFNNFEGLLPKASGRKWYEADINYNGGFRGSDRILFSNDGLIYKTTDHYKTFTEIKLE